MEVVRYGVLISITYRLGWVSVNACTGSFLMTLGRNLGPLVLGGDGE
jgi:hypothetical protein